jgi:hypothetical protein
MVDTPTQEEGERDISKCANITTQNNTNTGIPA